MDREQRAVMSMHIRRLGDGDKAQYLEHFKESRDITVGEYQEYMDDRDRQLDILRNTPFTDVGMSVHIDVMNDIPPLLPSLLSAAVAPLAAPIAAAAAEINDHMKYFIPTSMVKSNKVQPFNFDIVEEIKKELGGKNNEKR